VKDFGNGSEGNSNTGISTNVTNQDTLPRLSIVLPAYNEAETIRDVVTDFFNEIATNVPSRLIVAEDGSVDQTPQILSSLSREIPITLLSSRGRKGYAKGVSDALRNCREDWVFFSDSDGQYSPSDFWRLWENRYGQDMVIGHKISRNEGVHRTVLSKGFHKIFNNLFGLDFHDADCGFRLIRREVIQSVIDEVKILEYSFWTEFTIRASLKNFRIREVPIGHASRGNGNTRMYPPSKLPFIIFSQLWGIANLYVDVRRPELSV